MTELLEQAIAALRRLPRNEQVALAVLLLDALADHRVHILSAEDRAAIAISREQAQRGEFVPRAEMDAFWAHWLPAKD